MWTAEHGARKMESMRSIRFRFLVYLSGPRPLHRSPGDPRVAKKVPPITEQRGYPYPLYAGL